MMSMKLFRNWLLALGVILLLANCKNKKPSLAGEDPVEVGDFIEFFPEIKLPYLLSDTEVGKKEKDSLLISYKVFTQFVPDSLLRLVTGKGVKPKIYPIGKAKVPGEETYLLAKVVAGDKKGAFVFAFDNDDQLIDGMPLMVVDQSPTTQQSASIDKVYGINKTVMRKNSDGSLSEGKDVYGLDKNTEKFMLIMTDALGDQETEVINPIDTVSRKHKYAADYGTAKTGLVSIRDGRKNDRLSFFIHFNKNNGACTGELKGEAVIKSASVAEYRLGGDPCALRFSFTSSSVSVKELEGCGVHRGLRCSFDGVFAKKKLPKPKPVKKK